MGFRHQEIKVLAKRAKEERGRCAIVVVKCGMEMLGNLFQGDPHPARIPVVADVLVKHGATTTRAHSLEVSAGGMSIESDLHLELNASVILSFTLPNASTVAIGARVCWHHGKETGFRFEPGDVERNHVKEWIENYLGL